MPNPLPDEIQKLRASLAALESQRALLGDVIEPAIAATRQQLASLQAQAAPTLPPEERRLITILFTDIVGSTSIAEQLDPEDWRAIVANLHTTVGNLITQHHGTVAQYLGDGLVAFFGAHQSSEQDAENAIRAALEIQTAVRTVETQNFASLQIRIGIHTGLVVIGELGADAHKEFTATGDAMNLAARLQSAAPPDGVLISDDTYRYVRGVFDVTPQPPLTVKGKREPLATLLVRRAKPRAFRVGTRGVWGIHTRTIGRDAELEQLRRAYREAYEHGRVVWVQLVGEPGVGKSRLMQEMDDWIELREEAVRSLRGRAFAGEQNQPFALIRHIWFDRFQIVNDAPLAQAEAKWVERFREQTGISDEEPAHALGLLVGLPFADSPHIGAMRNDPTQVKGRAFVVSKQALRAIRATTPIQLMLEDLQWADASSLEYLQAVVMEGESESGTGDRETGTQGMFVLASARPEWTNVIASAVLFNRTTHSPLEDETASGQRPPLAMTIDLAPLTDSSTRELAQELLQAVTDVPPHVIDLIVERAEGVPYFAEEMVNYFLDRGIIDRSREPWQFVQGRLQESPLPTTLQHLLLTRLGALSDVERAALQRGAIFGRNFWAGGVEHLGVSGSNRVLEPLQPRGFVEIQPDSALEGEREWSFHHALLREVTYESVLKRERAGLHRKAADWLEGQAKRAGRLDEFAGLLAEHAERAGDLKAAAEWDVRAGERANGQGATREAKHFFERALAHLPPTEKERRWRALAGHEKVLEILGEREQNQVDVEALLMLAAEMDDDARRAEAYVRQARAANRAGENRRSVEAADLAVAAAKRAGNEPIALQARCLRAFAMSRLDEVPAAAPLAEEVLAEARALGEDTILGEVLLRAGVVLTETGDPARGIELEEEAAQVAQRLGDRYHVTIALSNLGYAYAQLGLYKLARVRLEQALALDEAIGARRARGYTLENLGLVYFRLGDGRAARRVLNEALREMTAVGDTFGRAAAVQYLGYELEQSGDFSGAARRFQDALEGLSAIEAHSLTQDVRVGLARCCLGQGQLNEARQQVTQVWDYLREHGAAGIEFPTWAYWTCADMFDALGDSESSRAAIEAGYRELITRADKISNVEWRKSFLENVPEHRAMVELWERNH